MMYCTKNMALSSLCEIQSGYTARTRLETTKKGGVPAVQLRDLKGEDEYDPTHAANYTLGPSFERYWAGNGDILFRSRGEKNTAVHVASGTGAAAIAILPLMVLRPDPDLIDSRYLAWYINQPPAQLHFDKCARGTRLRMIPKKCIDELEVPVPDLATQRRIVEIDMLAQRERALLSELAEKKKAYTNFVLLEQVRSAQPHGNGAGQSVARKPSKQPGKPQRTNS